MRSQIVQRFVDNVAKAQRAKSRVLTIPLDEAQDLAGQLAILLARENELLEEINELRAQDSTVKINMGGGGF